MKIISNIYVKHFIRIFVIFSFALFHFSSFSQTRDSEFVLEQVAKDISMYYDQEYSRKMRITPVAFVMEDMHVSRLIELELHIKTWLDHYLVYYSNVPEQRSYQMVERDRVDKIWEAQKRACADDVSTECTIQLGNNLAASSLIFAMVYPEGSKDWYVLKIKIANAENGGIENSIIRKIHFKTEPSNSSKPESIKDKGPKKPVVSKSTTKKSRESSNNLAQMGPRVGIGLAAQSVGGLFQNTTNLMPAPLFGWHFEAPLHPQVSFTPEVLYMTKGFMVRNPMLATRDQVTYRYLEVPLLAKVSVDKKSDGMFLLIGPSMGYYLSGRYRRWLDGELIMDHKYDLKDSERRFQFSGLIGIGMEGPRWTFDVRAQTSLTPFDRFVRSQNVVYALTFAYRIGGGKKDEPRDEDR